METKYSLTTLLNDLLKIQNNGYNILTSLSDIVSSNADTVIVDVEDANGVVQQVTVPSFGSIKNQLVRLENNQKSLSGIGDTNAEVQLSDGTFRKILVSSLQKEAEDIQSVSTPTGFNTRENWFFESFLNPLMYVSFDLTNQIKFNTERVVIERYILNVDTEDKKTIITDNFLGNSEIGYQAFARICQENSITYFLDRDTIDLPPRAVRYNGKFSVTNIFDDTVNETVDGISVQKRVLRVKLDKLTYSDNQSEFQGTQSLKIGDSLIVNSARKNTRYQITGIDASTRTVNLKWIEGFDKILIGSNSLQLYSADDAPVNVDVNIGFNEYTVIFIKPVDPDSKIASTNWSPGSGFYTNDLTIRDTNDQLITLSQYYQNEVVDFGSYLYSLAKEQITPAAFGIEPDSPILSDTDFRVVQVNQHATNGSALDDLKRLQQDKIRIESQIKTLDKSIDDLRTKIQTTRYSSQRLEKADRDELSKLIDEKASQSSLFSSTVNDIVAIGDANTLDNLTPKYRVRGFFPIPEGKTSERTGTQEIIQFEYQYRYLRKDGASNNPEQISFTDNDGETEKRGTFTTWIPVKSDIRKRVTDPTTGKITWEVEDVEDADTVNINQIDIPISSGEAVEFRVRSISEAGWPTSPKVSPFSSIVNIPFPDDLEGQPDAESIIEESKRQKVVVDVNESLNSLGVEKHVASQFDAGGKFYAHSALEIASGFLTPEQGIISLFDKLNSIDSEVGRLRALIENSRGVLTVRIVDELGTEYEVKNNSIVKLFAGNYRDQVASFTVKKGVIITKTFYVKVGNSASSNLELYARFWGDRLSQQQGSFTGSSTYDANDSDYNAIRRYDKVPIGLQNPDSSDVSTYGFIRNTPEQSSQVKGQFIQMRYLSIDGKTELYSKLDGASGDVANAFNEIAGLPFLASTSTEDLEYHYNNAFAPASTGSTSSGDFIWKGSNTTTLSKEVTLFTDPAVVSALPNDILVHIAHPEIDNWISTANPNLTAEDEIRNSVFANVPVGSSGENKQTALFFEGSGGPSDKYAKLGFEPNDQYLIGPRSVGSYLFLNPDQHNSIRVDGNDSLSFKTIEFGSNNAFFIPFTFQYRMTDFFGDGTSGLGNVGGDTNANSSTNLFYKKTLGIDIFANPINKEKFSFDVEVSARYYSKSITTKDIPSRSFEVAIDDLNQTIKNITPGSSRDTGTGRNAATS